MAAVYEFDGDDDAGFMAPEVSPVTMVADRYEVQPGARRKHRDVLLAFAKRSDMDGKHVEPVVQILDLNDDAGRPLS